MVNTLLGNHGICPSAHLNTRFNVIFFHYKVLLLRRGLSMGLTVWGMNMNLSHVSFSSVQFLTSLVSTDQGTSSVAFGHQNAEMPHHHFPSHTSGPA